MHKHTLTFFISILLLSSVQAMNSKKYQSSIKESIQNNNSQLFFDRVKKDFISSCAKVPEKLSPEQIAKLNKYNRQYKFAKLLREHQLSQHREFLLWLVDNKNYWQLFIDNIKKEDRVSQVINILSTLQKLNKETKSFKTAKADFFPLALAIAVVWDSPRPDMHYQMGRKRLKNMPTPTQLFTYFTKLYSSSKAKVRYRKIAINDLIYVVNTPVPISELEWALKNTSGSSKGWGSKYASIEYDTPRLAADEMSWPHYNGYYSLENIKEHGGICVDQAYFAVMTGRANGIPTMYFRGRGKRGNHAWMGFYRKQNEWITDVGQYQGDNYAIGHTKNPQTDKRLSDHQLKFSCLRKFRSSRYIQTKPLVHASEILFKEEQYKLAYNYAKQARSTAALYVKSWDIEEAVLKSQKNNLLLKQFYISKIKAFRKSPDILVDAQKAQARLLAQLGENKKALKIYQKSSKKQKNTRSDLAEGSILEQHEALAEMKEYKKAAKVLEKYIKKNTDQQSRIFTLMSTYISFCQQHKMQKQACRFIKKIYASMKGSTDDFVILQLMEIMKRAYVTAGDKHGIKKTQKEIDRFIKEQERLANKDRKRNKRRQEEENNSYN